MPGACGQMPASLPQTEPDEPCREFREPGNEPGEPGRPEAARLRRARGEAVYGKDVRLWRLEI